MGSTPIVRSLIPMIFIGTAGWTIPKESKSAFPADGSHLERYAQVFNAVEINSSFYRPHRISTYQRWAATVPPDFRFSVKLPREITHKKRFVDVGADLDAFLEQATSLGEKLGPILIQLPPSFAFDLKLVQSFLEGMRSRFNGRIAIEPRHESWLSREVDELLRDFGITRVRADPPVPETALIRPPAHSPEFTYYRLHGSPRVYYSPYTETFIRSLADEISAEVVDVWCIFDNTALGYATSDAQDLRNLLREP